MGLFAFEFAFRAPTHPRPAPDHAARIDPPCRFRTTDPGRRHPHLYDRFDSIRFDASQIVT
ncbi:MAG TPA: hypothetical protein DCG14_10480 [Phycisphaerales bacterium]|nr:hypothetical protein [Phycisphaerales bacterium]